MKAIELKPTDLLAVSIPLETIHTEILNKETLRTAVLVYTSNVNSFPIVIPNGDYEILGTCTADHIDFDVTQFVEQVIIRNEVPTRAAGFLDSYRFKNYQSENQYNDSLDSPDASFRSLLSSNGVWFENPYGEEPKPEHYTDCNEEQNCRDYLYNLDKWRQAESNIVQKLLIIKPLK